MTAKLLMIALDGADSVRLYRWSADGTLPNLAALRERGVVRPLAAMRGITDDALWASFQFGAGMGVHGRYHWQQRLAAGEFGLAYLEDPALESFWQALSRQGHRVAVFDVPKCGPPVPVNGIHLVDWLVHGRYFPQPCSHPPALAGEVVARFGPAPPSTCDYEAEVLDDCGVREIAGNLHTAIARKSAAALHYLDAERWDLFLLGFKAAHCAGHHLWDLADAQCPGYDPARVARLGDPVRALYRHLDQALGELVAAAGPDAAVAVFSTSAMVSNATLDHLMPGVVRAVNRELRGAPWRRVLRRLRQGATAGAGPFCEILPYTENAAALRICPPSAAGGTSDPARTRQWLDQVEALLRELTAAESGRPVIAGFDRPSTVFQGARAASLPDLLVHCVPGTIPPAIQSPRLGRIAAPIPALRPGNHAPGGLLLLAGAPAQDIAAMQDLGKLAAQLLAPRR